MKTSYSRFAFAALLCCGMFLINHNARAQCPDSTGPAPKPDIVPWIQDSSEVMIPGTDCWIWMYYCERTLPGSPSDTVQAWLDGVLVDSNSDCDSLADSTLVNDAQLMLDSVVAAGNLGKLEPCFKNQYLITQVFTPTCWSPQPLTGVSGQHGVYIAQCSAFGYYCEKQCQVCWNPVTSQPVIQNCVVTTSGGFIECSSGPWTNYGCYAASCSSLF